MAAIGQRAARGERDEVAQTRCLPEQELLQRLDEEIARAQRMDGELCCLLVRLDDFEQIAIAHGVELSEAALVHASQALCVDLRRYDRVGRSAQDELLLLLPGAGTAQGEAVARRALRRMMAIKIEVGRVRVPLSISVGIASWQTSWSAQRMIEEARAATGASGRPAAGSTGRAAGAGEV